MKKSYIYIYLIQELEIINNLLYRIYSKPYPGNSSSSYGNSNFRCLLEFPLQYVEFHDNQLLLAHIHTVANLDLVFAAGYFKSST